jgi:hypothetical protein
VLHPAVLAVATLLLAFAGWRILTLGLAVHHAVGSPATALRWRAGLPEAVLNQSLQRVRDKQTPGSDEGLPQAIGDAPLLPLGYRLLAHEAEVAKQPARAAALYELAAARGPRDLPSLAWVGQHELAIGDFPSALSRYDQMMRVEPNASHHLQPILLATAAHRPAQRAFAQLLQRHPPWREEFMVRLISRSAAIAPIFPLVEKLRTTPPGLSHDELAAWIARLAHEGQWGAAYLVWVQSLGPEASQHIGNVYNGGFEFEPSQLGFDWQYRSSPGATVSRVQTSGAGGERALRLEFEDRRIQFPRLQQVLALAPGSYRLRGRVRLDDLRSERGLVWTLTCATGTPLAETEPFSGRREWRQFEVQFVVPNEKCGGQILSLRLPARIKAETRIGGVAWFDDLSIKSR